MGYIYTPNFSLPAPTTLGTVISAGDVENLAEAVDSSMETIVGNAQVLLQQPTTGVYAVGPTSVPAGSSTALSWTAANARWDKTGLAATNYITVPAGRWRAYGWVQVTGGSGPSFVRLSLKPDLSATSQFCRRKSNVTTAFYGPIGISTALAATGSGTRMYLTVFLNGSGTFTASGQISIARLGDAL